MLQLQRYLLFGATALFIYMPFHIFLSQWLSTFTGGLETWKIGKDVFTALLTVLCVVTIVWRRLYTKTYLWILGLTVVYGLLHLTLWFSTNQPADTGILATVYNVRIFCYALIGYSLALLIPNSKILIPKFTRILIIVSTAVCLLALAQWLLPKDILTHFGYSIDRGVKPAFFIDNKGDLPRVFSTLREPNSLGAYLLIASTILTGSIIKYWKTNRRMLLGGLLLLHILILFLTFSRSALAGLLISQLLLLGYLARSLIKKFAVPLAVVLLTLSIGLFALRDQYFVQNFIFHSDENSESSISSNDDHFTAAQRGIDGVADQPLGHGPGTAGPVSVHSGGLITENYYVQIAYEAGIIGLLLFIAALYFILKSLWKNRKDALAVYLLASFVGLALMNLLLHTWANEAVAITWFTLAGIVCGQYKSKAT
jgi:hypothetical protein